MKKLLSLGLLLCLLATAAGCRRSGPDENDPQGGDAYTLGLGVVSAYGSVSHAEHGKNGSSELTHTLAAVLLDKNGVITDCRLDAIDIKGSYTENGVYVPPASLATKHEQGEGYGMKAYGGADKEWYEQADALASLAVGKKADTLGTLMNGDGRGSDEVISAGCTISVSDFVKSIEEATKNAKTELSGKDVTLSIGLCATEIASRNATASQWGEAETETTFAATVTDADGKVIVTLTDAVATTFTFDHTGHATTNQEKAIETKRMLGQSYGMKSYGGAEKEWFEQADAFDAVCRGKRADEIAALAAEGGKGNGEVLQAGCTITVTDLVKAVIKAINNE